MTQREVVPLNEGLGIHSIIFPEVAEINQKRSYKLSLRRLAKGQHAYSKFKADAEQAILDQQRRRDWVSETRARFFMSILGGLLLIVPMLIMTLHKSQTISLVTVPAAVLIFAIVIAAASTAKPHEVLGATAAYAAVLVVFVGTSITTNPPN